MESIDYESHATETSHELLVLGFHKIGLPPAGSGSTWFYIPDSVFDGYLKELRDSTWQVIDAGTFVEGLSHPETLPPRSALLTFDDGYCSMRHTAVPRLSAYRFPSVVFVPTSFVGDTNRFDCDIEPEEPICGWEDLLEMQRTGVSVQSHGVTHRRLSELVPGRLASQGCVRKAPVPRPVRCQAIQSISARAAPAALSAGPHHSRHRTQGRLGHEHTFRTTSGLHLLVLTVPGHKPREHLTWRPASRTISQ